MNLVIIAIAWIVWWDKVGHHCHCYQSDFHWSDQSLRQFTLLINCMLRLLAWLSKLSIILIDLTFINLICHWDNSLYSWISCLVLLFIWAPMQLWLLDHLATSLDLSAISGLLYYQERLSSDKKSMQKLSCWHSESRSNYIQLAILLPLHLRLCRWDDKREFFLHAHPSDAERQW